MKRLLTWLLHVAWLVLMPSLTAQQQVGDLEYFIDLDPGFGNGISVPGAVAEIVDRSLTVDTDTLAPGFHTLYVRARTESSPARWSMVQSRPIFIASAMPDLAAIDRIEYFIDRDPGYGNGVAVDLSGADGDAFDRTVAFTPDVTGLDDGFHTLLIRAQDASGRWSMVQSQVFLIVPGNIVTQSLTGLEYFVDRDPGFGNGIAISGAGDDVNVMFTLDDVPEPGFHTVHVRARNLDNAWSTIASRVFLVTSTAPVSHDMVALEYFVDDDPGYGNGVDVPIAQSAVVDSTFLVDVTGLTPGFHTLHVRVRNTAGLWSVLQNRLFWIVEPDVDVSDISGFEYFIDHDPGFGNGTMVTTAGSSIDTTFAVDVTGIAPGAHALYVRARSAAGRWSIVQSRLFVVESEVDPVAELSAIEYFIDHDPGFGNGIAVPFDTETEEVSFVVDITNLDPGFHSLYARARNDMGRWSIVQSRLVFIPQPIPPHTGIEFLEYFVDRDPGYGGGTQIPFASDSEDSTVVIGGFTVGPAGLEPGFHTVFVRARNADDQWSVIQARTFFIGREPRVVPELVRIEYFIDRDPGVGMGTPVSVSGSRDVITFFTVDAETAGPGWHTVHVRGEDSAGHWSILQSQTFVVLPAVDHETHIDRVEYFFDADPGYANGRSVALPVGGISLDNVDLTFQPEVRMLQSGCHALYVRARDAEDEWSIVHSSQVDISSVAENAVSISSAHVAEGYRESVTLDFEVVLNEVAGRSMPVTVDYRISPGSATPIADYQPITGTVSFQPGSNRQTIRVVVYPDDTVEADETVMIRLGNPANAVIVDDRATGTIVDVSTVIVAVENTADSGPGSLRRAVANAQDGQTIIFNVSGTITLATGTLVITRDLTLSGPDDGGIIISGGLGSRIFDIIDADVTMRNLVIRDGNAADGGAVRCVNSRLEMMSCGLTNNTATGNGGAIHHDGVNGQLSLRGCALWGNHAAFDGGGLWNNAAVEIVNCTLSENIAGRDGGGVFNHVEGNGNATLATIVHNTAATSGGGIANGGNWTVSGTIIANNIAEDCEGTISSADYNVDGDGSCVLANMHDMSAIDPQLGPLTHPTTVTAVHVPLAGSTVIDAGPTTFRDDQDNAVVIDQRGTARPVDGDNDTMSASDIGAVEAAFTAAPTVRISSHDNGDRLAVPVDTTISAMAAATETTIESVTFFVDGEPIGDVTEEPYDIAWQTPLSGQYHIHAAVTDDRGVTISSEGVNVIAEPLDITFVRPDAETRVAPQQPLLVLWDIRTVDLSFYFDLYALQTPSVDADTVVNTGEILATGLDVQDYLSGYNHLPGIDTTLESDNDVELWYVAIHVTDSDSPYFDTVFTSSFPFTVTNDASSNMIILRPPEASTIRYGDEVHVDAVFTDGAGDIPGGLVEVGFAFAGPGNQFIERPADTVQDPDIGNRSSTVAFAPPSTGVWDISVRGPKNRLDFNESVERRTLRVQRVDSELVLSLSGDVADFGADVDVSATLSLSNGNPGGVDLTGVPVVLTVTHPFASVNGPISTHEATSDATGMVDWTLPSTLLDSDGVWRLRARMSGTGNIHASASAVHDVEIRSRRGYAILVQGQVSEGDGSEGLDVHRNTLEFAESAFLSSGFNADDIHWVTWAPGESSMAKLTQAIEGWASNKINASPAPLYVVLVNHGSPKTFHLGPGADENLSPEQLDGMISTLESNLSSNALADSQPIVLMLGMCYGGSFVPEISAPGRIVISTSESYERSIREPGNPPVGQQGEYFIYLLMNELRSRRSLAESFRRSAHAVSCLSEHLLFDRAVGGFAETGQHPLLDDNGDGRGSRLAFHNQGDGGFASNIFLNTGSELPSVRIVDRSPSRFLNSTDDVTDLTPNGDSAVWVRLDDIPADRSQLQVRMEIRPPGSENIAFDAGETMQINLEFDGRQMVESTTEPDVFVWPDPSNPGDANALFAAPGRYEIFVFVAEDETTPSPAPAILSLYRGDGTDEPEEFGQLQPLPGAIVDFNTVPGIFEWDRSTASSIIRYIWRLWSNDSHADDGLVYESVPLRSTFFVPPRRIIAGLVNDDYWWDVVAVDRRGNAKSSNESARKVVIRKSNALLLNFVTGRITDYESGEPIEGVDESVIGVGASEIGVDASVVKKYYPDSGNYLVAVTNTAETIELGINVGGYHPESFLEVIVADVEVAFEHHFRMRPISATADNVQLTINSPFGAPRGGGTYLRGDVARWSVTTPWSTDSDIRFVTATSAGTAEMTEDKTVIVPWTRQNRLRFNSDHPSRSGLGQPTTGDGWHRHESTVLWAVTSPDVVIPLQEQFVARTPNGAINILDAPQTVPVEWDRQFFLDVDTNGLGAGSIAGDRGWIAAGQSIELAATNSDTFTFIEWRGAISEGTNRTTDNPVKVTMNRARRITAVFSPRGTNEVFTIALRRGWNLVSLPIIPFDNDVGDVFGGHIQGEVWEWQGVGYTPAEFIHPKVGYWVWAPLPASATVSGTLVTNRSLGFVKGWNLVGSVDEPSPLPTGVNNAWTWTGREFVTAAALRRLEGRWVFMP